MKYTDFESLVSIPRMSRYLTACGNQKRKAMTLYRANLRLSQQFFSVLGVFEVVLRNKIDSHYKLIYRPIIGNDEWLIHAANPGGFYATGHTSKTQQYILTAISELGSAYTHNKLLAELTFGFWRFQFGPKEFRAGGSTLHQVFINRPHGTNHTTVFNKLRLINNVRNRIAHHEPICFDITGNVISTVYVANHYNEIDELLRWMGIDAEDLFYGVDGIQKEIDFINHLI
jgi:hypothetical protein